MSLLGSALKLHNKTLPRHFCQHLATCSAGGDEVDASLEEEVAGTSWTLLRWQQTASVTVGLEAQVVIATVGVAGIAARVPLFPSHVVAPLLNTSTGAHDARRGKIVVWT